jgi:uncharacterized alpha-E superfamily protein
MLSRVADSMYWMNRYIERAENMARFIAVNFILTLDTGDRAGNQWLPLILAAGDERLFRQRYSSATKDDVVYFLTFDVNNPNSILSCLQAARENARSIREVISSEMWEQVNRFYLFVSNAARSTNAGTIEYDFFTQLKLEAHLFVGITEVTMSHNEAWHFGRLGRLIERADKTSRILDVKYYILLPKLDDIGSPLDETQWAAVLKSVSGLEMYRKIYRQVTPRDIAAFLVLDRDFPRSIYYALSRAQRSLYDITGSPQGEFRNTAEKTLGKIRSELEYADVQEIFAHGLHEYLDGIQIKLNTLGDRVFETFFALRPVEDVQ